VDYAGHIAIVVGGEGKGIRKKVIEHCDFLGSIPMQGDVNSLNVSAAVSAILFERLRQIKFK
jgi:tRNA G18 (ribose-2'-O)-methylase SpoU